jgi:hypothetical protein
MSYPRLNAHALLRLLRAEKEDKKCDEITQVFMQISVQSVED